MPAELIVDVLTLDELEPAFAAHFGVKVHLSSEIALPTEPGVYVWTTSRERIIYIGSGKSLLKRLGDEVRWVQGAEIESQWYCSVVYLLKKSDAVPHWIMTSSHSEAELLERRLIEWHRATTGIAPIAVGWDSKPNSRREAAEVWARELYNQLHPSAAE